MKMNLKNSDRKIEDNGSVTRRCKSTYKQEFVSMAKLNNFKDISSPSDREINLSPAFNTHKNLDIVSSNLQNDSNNIISDNNKYKKVILTDKNDSKNTFLNKKKTKLGSFLFKSSVNRNFSPQVLKTNLDFNLNYSNKNVSTSKNSQCFIKTNISNNANEDLYLTNNVSSKNFKTEIQMLNNSINQFACFKKVKSI